MAIVCRDYNSFKINKALGQIDKISTTERLADEIKYYVDLPSELQKFFPRFIKGEYRGQGKSHDNKYILTLEYLPYKNLGQIVFDSKSKPILEGIVDGIFDILEKFKAVSTTLHNTSHSCTQMYVDKTEREYHNLIYSSEYFRKLSSVQYIYFNGEKLLNFQWIWPQIKDKIFTKGFFPRIFYAISGDLCFSNILVHKSGSDIRFIDPRGSFGEKGVFGDVYYDYAKLLHSLAGYENIIYDKFKLTQRKDNFNLKFTNNNVNIIKPYFLKHFDRLNADIKKAELISGLIFIGMVFRHKDSLNRQKAQYLTGLKILNGAL